MRVDNRCQRLYKICFVYIIIGSIVYILVMAVSSVLNNHGDFDGKILCHTFEIVWVKSIRSPIQCECDGESLNASIDHSAWHGINKHCVDLLPRFVSIYFMWRLIAFHVHGPLLFIALCLHYGAFYDIFREKLGVFDSPQRSDFEVTFCQLVEFHIASKRWEICAEIQIEQK